MTSIVSEGSISWMFLFGAICSEVLGTTCMKLSAGFSRPLPAVGMAVCYVASLTSLTFALRRIEIGVAYAIWSGAGTLLIALIGVLAFREQLSALKLLSLFFVIIGMVGLKISLQAT